MATCNVGADNPWEYGKYFAWGETEGYYSNSGHVFDFTTYKFGDEENITKYNVSDGKMTLDAEDDAANANMGGNWRMPTETDFNELIGNTNYEWIEDYKGTGINGGLFTSQVNENTLFFLSAEHWTSNRRTVWDPLQVIRSVIDSAPWLYGDDDDRADGKCVRGVLDA